MARSIIAFCGPMQSGKSTAADLLIEYNGYIRLSFASPVKQMLRTLVEMQGVDKRESYRMFFGDLKESATHYLAGRTPRHAMQTLGSEWRDLIDRNLWTKIWLNATVHVPKVVVDDMRFTHEAATVKELGGNIIFLDRSDCGPGTHISETDYLNIVPDRKITNDGTIEDLYTTILKTELVLL